MLGQKACNDCLHERMMKQMSEEELVERQAKKRKLRHAVDSDKFLCGKSLPVSFPPSEEGGEPWVMNVAWSTKDAGLEVELNKDNLEYIVKAISSSPPIEKKVPKSPRRRRKRHVESPEGKSPGHPSPAPAAAEEVNLED